MYQCETHGHSCEGENGYHDFNEYITREMPGIPIDSVINKSKICFQLPIDFLSKSRKRSLNGLPTLNGLMSVLSKRIGVYHIWQCENEYCQNHEMRFLRCIYVGKGNAEDRVKSHIRNKLSESENIFVSFYECENRVAKYLEQLFLDCFGPELNKSEKRGKSTLFARWSEDRYLNGSGSEKIERFFVNN